MLKFSIIIPIYNVEKYIRKCLDNVICQNYKNVEIILVDDGSPDDCGKICDEYSRKDKRIKVIHKKNGGLSDARNVGLKAATGDYLIFVDSDDVISPNLCSVVNETLQKVNADIVQYGFSPFLDGNNPAIDLMQEIRICNIFDDDKIYENYLIKEKISREAWNKAYRRNLFEKIEYPKGRLAEDLATTYKLLHKAHKVVCLSNVLYHYRKRENSIMSKGSTKLYYDAMLDHYEIYLDSKNQKEKFQRIAYSNYFNNLMKIYAKLIIEKIDDDNRVQDRVKQIELQKLSIKSKIIYILYLVQKRTMLQIIYRIFVK